MFSDARRASARRAPDAGVRLTGDVEWISACVDLGVVHEHVSVYLVRTGAGALVVDSGSFCHEEHVRRRIDQATDGEGIRALILSHSDYPHSGNIPAFRTHWGDFEIVASCADPEIQGLPYATRVRLGEVTEVLGRRFTFVDPPLADRSHTTWIYDHASRVLFTADGFGSYHVAGECESVSTAFADGVPAARIHEYHRDTFPWLRYVDPDKLRSRLFELFRQLPAAWIAPVHGHPVAAADLDQYLDRLCTAAERIAAAYSIPG